MKKTDVIYMRVNTTVKRKFKQAARKEGEPSLTAWILKVLKFRAEKVLDGTD